MSDASEQPSRKGPPWSTADRVLLGALALVAGYCLLQILLMKFGRDQGIYAVVADTVLRGGMPYRDAWDFKPPGIFVVYTLAHGLFGSNEWSIRLMEVAAFLSLVPVLGTLARRFFGDARIGWVAAVLSIWMQAQLEFWHTAQPESFGGVLALAGLAVSTHPARFDTASARWKPWLRWFAAGLLFGASGLMKPHLLGVPIVAALHAAWHLRVLEEPWRRQLGAFVSIGVGSVATVLACVAWFAARGALGDLHHTLFVFAPGYASTTWNAQLLLHYSYAAVYRATGGYSAIVGIGLVLSVAIGSRMPREREGLWLIAAAALPQTLGIAVQSKFFAYHFGATLPFCALLAAPGLWKAWRWAQRFRWVGAPLFGIGLLAAADARTATVDLSETFLQRSWKRTHALVTGTAEDRARIDGELYTVADVHYGANMLVAAWLQQNTEPDDTVFIWGFEPHVHVASGRRPASRFIYNVPQRVAWENQWARDKLLEDLRHNPPEVIVVEHGDVFPLVTGNHDDSARALMDFPELQAWMGDYSLRDRIQDFDLYVRR